MYEEELPKATKRINQCENNSMQRGDGGKGKEEGCGAFYFIPAFFSLMRRKSSLIPSSISSRTLLFTVLLWSAGFVNRERRGEEKGEYRDT